MPAQRAQVSVLKFRFPAGVRSTTASAGSGFVSFCGCEYKPLETLPPILLTYLKHLKARLSGLQAKRFDQKFDGFKNPHLWY